VFANFQHIANLNNIFKILQRLFLTWLQPYIASSPSFNHLQSAYRKQHSTETSLIHPLDSIYHAADKGLATHLSLDLTAAFDTIDHTILLNRLTSSFGIMGSSHNWLKSYLSNRSFSVTSGSSSSFILPSSCGVPQGSVLGPILFTIYVSLIASIVSSHGVNQQQYTDDIQLFVFLSPASLSSSLCSLQWCLFSSQLVHPQWSGSKSNSNWGNLLWHQPTTPIPFQSNFYQGCGYICFTGRLRQATWCHFWQLKHLNFYKHISNVCSSSYFHVRALRHIPPFLDSETSKTIADAIVGSRLDYVNSILTGISSRNTSSSARSKLHGSSHYSLNYTNTTSVLNSLHWLPIQQRINFKLAMLLSTVHSTTLALNTCHLYYILTLHRVSSMPSIYRRHWPFSMEFPPSSSQIYRLLPCLQIQSKNSPFL